MQAEKIKEMIKKLERKEQQKLTQIMSDGCYDKYVSELAIMLTRSGEIECIDNGPAFEDGEYGEYLENEIKEGSTLLIYEDDETTRWYRDKCANGEKDFEKLCETEFSYEDLVKFIDERYQE